MPETIPTKLAAPLFGNNPGGDDDDSHPEYPRMTGKLDREAQGDLGGNDQRGEQDQYDQLES